MVNLLPSCQDKLYLDLRLYLARDNSIKNIQGNHVEKLACLTIGNDPRRKAKTVICQGIDRVTVIMSNQSGHLGISTCLTGNKV